MFVVVILPVFCALSLFANTPLKKVVVFDANQMYQTIEGFGVNITPAQWRDGNLKPVIDLLVDDLGCTLIRFDCWGRADWLDPQKRKTNGTYPEEYLKQVYTGAIFRDAWAIYGLFKTDPQNWTYTPKKLRYYRTSRNEDCCSITDAINSGNSLQAIITENSIFTLTTLDE